MTADDVAATSPANLPEPATHGARRRSGPDSTDLMDRLRLDTAAVHAATEVLPLMAALLAPTVTRADYRRYLAAVHAVYAAVEPVLYAALPRDTLARLPVRPKLAALQQDLVCAGGGLAAAALPARGWPTRARVLIDNPAAALGGLYVLEGATLGGRVIARRLQDRLGDGLPLGFLLFQTQDPAPAWRRFGEALRRAAAALGASEDAVVGGARAVFEAMHAALAETGSPYHD